MKIDLSERKPPAAWMRVLFLGDSLTTGARDPHGLSWPYYLAQQAMADGTVVLPEVDARNGRTSSELVREVLPVVEGTEAPEVLILIGTNDAKDERSLPTDHYIANISLLVAWCRTQGLRDYVLTIPTPKGFGSPGYSRETVGRIQSYNKALRELALPRLVECDDIRGTVDGIHVDEESAQELARRAWSAILSERTFE